MPSTILTMAGGDFNHAATARATPRSRDPIVWILFLAQLTRAAAIRLIGAIGGIERRIGALAGIDVARRRRCGAGGAGIGLSGLLRRRARRLGAQRTEAPRAARIGLIGAVGRTEGVIGAAAGRHVAL